MTRQRRDDLLTIIECYYPWMFGSVVTVVASLFYWDTEIEISTQMSNLVNSITTFASVNVGFVGVLLGILFSVKDAPLIKGLFEREHTKGLTSRYFKESIVGGLALVILSSCLHVMTPIEVLLPNGAIIYISTLVISGWAGLVTYALLASFRIMSLMMKALFKSGQPSSRLGGPSMDESERQNLRDQFKAK